MNYTLILTIIASLAVGGAAGASAKHWLTPSPQVAQPACPHDTSWRQFLGPPAQPQAGKTYK